MLESWKACGLWWWRALQECGMIRAALDTVVMAAMRAVGADAAAVRLVDASAPGVLIPSASRGLPEGLSAASIEQFDREVLAKGQAFLSAGADARADPHLGIITILAIRLGPADRPLGALHLYSFDPTHFTTERVVQAQTLAELGAVAIEASRQASELEQVEANQAQFIHVATHELRSPLAVSQSLVRNVVKGYAGPLTEKQQYIFSRISAQLDSLESLVNDLLDLAASKAPGAAVDEGQVALNGSVGRVVLLLQPRAEEKGVELSYHACRNELVVWATEEGLDRILVNLVGNAVKYTPPGGQVTVGICGSDDEISATVTDTGIGIPPEALPHLFEEFYRAPNARATNIVGTGLGLAIVKKLVERYRGKIEVESTPGKGTTITVVFPTYRPNG